MGDRPTYAEIQKLLADMETRHREEKADLQRQLKDMHSRLVQYESLVKDATCRHIAVNCAIDEGAPASIVIENTLVVERAKLTEAQSQLAECYRLSGADPDGNEDWRLAGSAVEEVRRLRQESDEQIEVNNRIGGQLEEAHAKMRGMECQIVALREAADYALENLTKLKFDYESQFAEFSYLETSITRLDEALTSTTEAYERIRREWREATIDECLAAMKKRYDAYESIEGKAFGKDMLMLVQALKEGGE